MAVPKISLILLSTSLLCSAAFGQFAQTAAQDANTTPLGANVLPDLTIIAPTPMLGAGVDRNKVPAATNVLTPEDLDRTGIPTLTGGLAEKIPGVNLNDASGNSFQPSLMFRGFLASPVQGDEQGLAVYVNGARFNQPFGDTVNWDLIPANAINRVDVEGSNPVFGLNALGGSVSVQMKNGFTYQGAEAIGYGGSFGRAAGLVQYGVQSGNTAAYFAGAVTDDQGWRTTSASQLYQAYGDIGWRGHDAEVHVNLIADSTNLGNPGATPVDLLAVNRATNSTAPNAVYNRYELFNVNGTYDITDETSVQGVLYYSNLNQRLTNGVTVDAATCADGSGNLCTNGGTGSYLTGLNGQPINDFLNGGSYGGVSYQGTDSNAWGASAQITNTHDVFGLANHAVAGVSYDGGNSTFTGSQTIGFLNPQRFVGPPEVVIDQADLSIAPVRLNTTNNYYGVFFSDMLSLTDKLTLSLSGRFNAANIALHDDVNLALNGTHNFTHFNPGVGATYAVTNDVAVYASYAVSNRAPTPSELSCANPGTPCQLPNFFIGDPNLKQVVAGTIEFGVRGKFADVLGAKGFWNIDLYRSNSNDDIIYEASPVNNNAGFYSNAGTTRRQGIEANLTLTRGALRATLGYALVNATFQSPLILSSPNNPAADVNGLIYVNPGNKIPGIPENRVKLIVDYAITDKWTVGGSGIFASSQYLFGDEANQNSQLPGYFVLTLNTSYQVTDHIALFGLVNNVFDRKYETYGTYAQVIGLPAPELPGGSVTTSRVASPAPPIAGFGGVRIIF